MSAGRKVLQKKLKEKKREYSFPDEVDIPAILGSVFFVLLRVGIIALPSNYDEHQRGRYRPMHADLLPTHLLVNQNSKSKNQKNQISFKSAKRPDRIAMPRQHNV